MTRSHGLASVWAACALALGVAGAGQAANLYNQDFDVDDTVNWTVNGGPADEAANFFFNYSAAGIPSAPNSLGGTTRGLNLQANMSANIFGGFSVSPTGRSFAGNYTVKFDWWSNFNGPAPVGGNGSTQLSTFGVRTSGTVAQWAGGVQDSVWFAATGDGNSSMDYRAYSSLAPTSYLAASGVYAAGTGANATNSSDPYYAVFGSRQAPAAQMGLFPQQTGTTLIGSAAFAWHDVEIAKQGAIITWTVDGRLIATVNAAGTTLGGGNIFFGHSDTNAGASSDPNDVNLLFTLIDNIQVNSTFLPGDFDVDGDVDVTDYLTLSAHLLTDVSMLTLPQTYALGDMTQDRRIDGMDFRDFRVAYDAANAPGAFVVMLDAIPEPSTAALAALGLAALWRRQRSSSRRPG